MQTINEIVKREWDFFQEARNEGGRAACQNDWETFRIMRESQFENNIHIYRDCIAISTFEGRASNNDRIAAAKAADRLLTIEGVSTSFVLCTIGDEISISARSDGNINVQLVLEALGGGGHFDAAGAQVKGMTMREVLEKLKESIDEFMNA